MPLSSTYILIGRYLIKFVYTNLPTCISNQVVEPYPSGINVKNNYYRQPDHG